MGKGWLVVFLQPSWCRGWLLCKKRADEEGMTRPPELAVTMSLGAVIYEKRAAVLVGSENAVSGKTCRFYEVLVPELP